MATIHENVSFSMASLRIFLVSILADLLVLKVPDSPSSLMPVYVVLNMNLIVAAWQ